MNGLFVYCELIDNGQIADVSLELLSKGKKLSSQLGCSLEAVVIGSNIFEIEKELFPYGVDIVHIAEDDKLFPYSTLPHTSILTNIIKKEQPQIVLFGATPIGRDLAPRIASSLKCGLTADCTNLEIGDHTENKTGKTYKNLLYQIRPAFGGNIIATIINPETKPQMATVREGVMKKAIYDTKYVGKVNRINLNGILKNEDFALKIIERHIEERKVNIKNAQIIVAGGYGMGSKENFDILFELADVLGAQVGASRAAVDAGFVNHERQVGQTGVTVRPKLYIACGISGAVQHRAGMDQSAKILSINTDPNAPINYIADYAIIGDVMEVIPKMIKYYKENSK